MMPFTPEAKFCRVSSWHEIAGGSAQELAEAKVYICEAAEKNREQTTKE